MPDHAVDEETQVRTHSLCLYGTPGITLPTSKRCDNCPGAARSPQYHQRQCPLDFSSDYNILTGKLQAGKSDGRKSLASSNSSSDAVVETKVGQNHGISFNESRLASEVLSTLNTFSPSLARSVSDSHVGRKRKADHRPEGSSRNEVDDRQGEEDFHTQKPHSRQKPLEEEFKHSLSISNQPEGLLRREQARAVSVIPVESNERTRVSGDHADHLANVPEDRRSNVREDLRNKSEVIFQDIPFEKPVPMAYCGINASPNAPGSCFYQSLMEIEEILGPSEEAQRNE